MRKRNSVLFRALQLTFLSQILLLLLLSCEHALAQPDTSVLDGEAPDETPLLWFGGYAGFHPNFHSVEFSSLRIGENCCDDFTDTESSALTLGLHVEMPLSEVLRLQLRGGVQGLGGDFSALAEDARRTTVISPNGDTSVVPIVVERRLKADIATFTIEPTMAYYLLPRFALIGGFKASVISTFDVDYDEVISEPSNVRFLDGSDTRFNFSGELESRESLAFSAVIGASYDLPIAEQSSITPEVRYSLGLTDLAAEGWKTSSFQMGVALKIALPRVGTTTFRDTLYIRDTTTNVLAGITEPVLRRVSESVVYDTLERNFRVLVASTIRESYVRDVPSREFSVSINEMRLLDEDRNPIKAEDAQINQVEFVDNLPLLPYVFFNEGSSDLATTKVRTLRSVETESFDQFGLDSRDPLAMYPQLLNIIGARLRANRFARVTLTGCNSISGAEGRDPQLSRNRALAVREYLVETWSIDDSRIDILTRNLPEEPSNNNTDDGREENRRVEISSDTPEILQSVTSRSFIYESAIKTLVGSVNMSADAGIADWRVEFTLAGKKVAEASGAETQTGRIEWDIAPEELLEAGGVVNVALSARDKLGQERTAAAEYKVKIATVKQKRDRKVSDKAIERYLIAMFGYNQSEISDISRGEVIKLGNDLRSREFGSAEIHGYTDRTGASEYNERLALRRAEQVLKLLELPEERTTLLPIGSKVLLFDNDHPVGRFYSRTVEVRVVMDI